MNADALRKRLATLRMKDFPSQANPFCRQAPGDATAALFSRTRSVRDHASSAWQNADEATTLSVSYSRFVEPTNPTIGTGYRCDQGLEQKRCSMGRRLAPILRQFQWYRAFRKKALAFVSRRRRPGLAE